MEQWKTFEQAVLDKNVLLLMEEKLDDTGTQMKTSLRKSLHQLVVQSGVPKSSGQLLKLNIKLELWNNSFLYTWLLQASFKTQYPMDFLIQT
jgi:hypothetical protein